jgi:hypothetical protein
MKEYQVGVRYVADGYVTVGAKSVAEARRKVRSLGVQMDYGSCEANIDMMPLTPDVEITSEPVKVEPDEDE